MNTISILHFSGFIVYVLLIIYVIGKGPNSLLNRLCAVLISCFALISFSYGLANSTGSSNEALTFINLGVIGWCIAPMAGMWFYIAVTEKRKIVINKVIIACSVAVPVTLILLQWYGIMPVNAMRTEWGWATVWEKTPYAYIYLSYIVLVLLFCGFRIVRFLLDAGTSNKRNQGLILLITGIISFVPVIGMAMLFSLLRIRSLPQIPDILLLIWVVGIVIAISRYGLMTLTPDIAYEQILKTMGDSLMLLDEDGKITFSNRAAAYLLGAKSEQLKGSHISDFIEDKKQAVELLETTGKEGEARRELSFIPKHGSITQALVSSSVVWGTRHKCRGFVVSAADITERKRAEAQLKRHEELIERILENMPSAVLVLREDGTAILANKVFYERFSKAEAEVRGKLLEEIINENNLSRSVKAFLSGLINSGQIEFGYRAGGNKITYLIDIISMYQGNLLLVFNDVTEERDRQERLYLTDRLASIGEMAAGIAHEVNNPLTSVISLSKMLVEQDPGQDCREDLDAIYKEAVRASTVISNLLTFARKHPPVRQITRIENVLDDVLGLRSYEHKINTIDIEKVFENCLPEIVVDYYQMQQVFLNIILNAEHAMNEAHNRGHLIIDARKTNGHVVITFTDNGIGIAKENIKRIFDPFFTTKDVGKGTGLGLSICYGIVNNHGGRLSVKSEPGCGSSFIIELPVYCQSPVMTGVVSHG